MADHRVARKLLILTDSRGRDFRNQIPFIQVPALKVEVIVYSGATFETIAIHAIQLLSSSPDTYDLCAIFAGICSFTERTTLNNEHRLHYPLQERSAKISGVLETARDLKERFGRKIVFHTIIPASLPKYFFTRNNSIDFFPGIEEEQNALLKDLERVNDSLTSLNARAGNATCNLSNRFTSHSLKREYGGEKRIAYRLSRFSDTNLPDGIHPNLKSVINCLKAIYRAAQRDLGLLH